MAATLLDAASMTPHLTERFATPLSDVRVRYLEYLPGETLTVHYDGRLETGGVAEAYAHASPQGWRLHAYPDDPALPLLRCDTAGLADELRLHLGDAPIDRLAWVPGRRAVLRCGGVVIKLYADAAELHAARSALVALEGVVPTAQLISSQPDRGAVAQSALGGVALDRDAAALEAGGAVEILRRLHGAPIHGLPSLDPSDLLATAHRPAALVSFAAPALAERIRRIVEQLSNTKPVSGAVAAVHGDFNIGQLLRDGDQLWVVDVDTLASGSPSVDLAAYAANVHNGRPGDDDAVRTVLGALVGAYGEAPDDLAWHLATTMLRRIDRPLRRLKRQWPERIEAVVRSIEDLVR